MAKHELTSEPKLLADALKKQITSLKRRRAFVSYFEASELAYEVEKLSQDIFSQLLPLSPNLATQLLEKLLATAPQSLERCDDSNGCVGYAYQEMVVLWLLSARYMDKPQKHWIKKIKSLVESDNYCILDLLLPNANKLLSEESLRELALCYETEFENEKDEWQADRCSINICAIAEALGDCELFERGTLLRAPRPNERVRESLVRFFLKQNDAARALKWLKKSDDSSADWLIFQIESYQKLDELKKLPVLCEKLIM